MLRILLVEDDAIIAMAQAALLKRSGYDVTLAHSGEAAIRAVDGAEPPLDLVLMDVDLGPGIDGTEAASRILKSHDIPIVFVSSHTEKEMVEKTDRITSYGYVVKHSGETVLLASIKMAFRLYEAYRALTDQGKELRSTNEKYRRSQIRARIGSWEHDFVQDRLWWSEGMYQLLGFPPGTPVAMPEVMACFPPEEQVRFTAAVKKALEGQEPYTMEYSFIRPDGTLLKIRDEGEVIRDAGGRPIFMSGTTQDITEVWEAQKNIRQLSRSVEQSPTTVVITDVAGNIEYVNPKFTETTGYAAGEVIGKNPRLLKSGDTSDGAYRDLWKTITEGREWRGEFHNRRKDGSLYWESASISPIVDAMGAITHFVAVKEDITERKASDVRLRESETRFRTMADCSPVMIWATDAAARVTMVNRAYRSFFGVTEEDLISPEKWKALIPFEEEDGYIRAFRVATEGRAPFKARARVRVADGTVRWVDSQALPQFQPDGTFMGYVGSSTDITETKKFEAAMLESEAKYRNLVEMSEDAIFINYRMQFVYMNPAAVRMIGAADESQLLGRSPLDLFDAHDRGLIEERIRQMMKEGRGVPAVEFTLHRLDGATLAIEIIASPIVYRGEKAFQVVFRDISERKRIEAAHREQEELFRMVSTMTPYHVIVQDTDLRYAMVVNPQLGLTAEQMLGKTDEEIAPGAAAEQVTAAKRRVLVTGESVHVSDTIRLGDDRAEVFDGTFVPRRDDRGRVNGVIGYFRNVTKEREAETRLQQALRDREMLMKELEHRVKNTLSMVSGLLGMQVAALKDQAAREIFLDTQGRLRAVAQLYEQLYSTNSLASVDMRSYAERFARGFTRAFDDPHDHVRLSLDIADVTLDLQTAIPLCLILNEALTNAVRHAYPLGTTGEIRVSLTTSDGRLTLTVADDGVGMPVPTTEGSSGSMGLNLVRLLTTQLEGTCRIDGTRGTTVRIEVPGSTHAAGIPGAESTGS